MKNSTFHLYLILLFSVLLLACEGHAVTETVVRKLVGPEGGVVLGPKGSKLIIPPGLLTDRIEFSARELRDDEIWPFAARSGEDYALPYEVRSRVSAAVMFGPEGIEFDAPVSVELPYDQMDLSISQQEKMIRPFTCPRMKPIWELLDGNIQIDQHVYQAETTKLGVFTLILLKEEPQQEDGDTPLPECSCEDYSGDYYPSALPSCSGLSHFEIGLPDQENCETTVTAVNANNKEPQSFRLLNCAANIELTLPTASMGECIFRLDVEQKQIELDCLDCMETFTMDACE